MDDAASVRMGERLARLLADLHRPIRRGAMVLRFRQQIFDGATVPVLRDDERGSVFVARVKDRDDVGVIAKTPHRLSLAPHTDKAIGV